MSSSDEVDHPAHYGGRDDHYEVIKVIEAWGLGFRLGNTVKYIARAGKKGAALVDLKKAAWYLNREIEQRELELDSTPPPSPHDGAHTWTMECGCQFRRDKKGQMAVAVVCPVHKQPVA